LASGGRDGRVKVWDINSGTQLRSWDVGLELIKSVAFSPDGTTLAACGRGTNIKICDVASNDGVRSLETDSFFTTSCVIFSHDNRQLFFAGDTIELWELDSGERLRSYDGHSDSIGTLALSGNGKWIASGGGYEDRTISLWDVESGDRLWSHDLSNSGGGAWSVAFASNDEIVVVGGYDGSITYWDRASGSIGHKFQAHSQAVSSLSVSTDGMRVASGSWDNTIKLWELAALQNSREFPVPGDTQTRP
jgi:WD40 repeat protein